MIKKSLFIRVFDTQKVRYKLKIHLDNEQIKDLKKLFVHFHRMHWMNSPLYVEYINLSEYSLLHVWAINCENDYIEVYQYDLSFSYIWNIFEANILEVLDMGKYFDSQHKPDSKILLSLLKKWYTPEILIQQIDQWSKRDSEYCGYNNNKNIVIINAFL